MKLIKLAGILILISAHLIDSMLTESNAFLMSCKRIHISLSFCFASSIRLLTICIGLFVLSPGNSAKLRPLRILCSTNTELSILCIILIKDFLKVFSSIIGLVLLSMRSHSASFGIRKICPIFYFLGKYPVDRITLINSRKTFVALVPALLIRVYEMPEFPRAVLALAS